MTAWAGRSRFNHESGAVCLQLTMHRALLFLAGLSGVLGQLTCSERADLARTCFMTRDRTYEVSLLECCPSYNNLVNNDVSACGNELTQLGNDYGLNPVDAAILYSYGSNCPAFSVPECRGTTSALWSCVAPALATSGTPAILSSCCSIYHDSDRKCRGFDFFDPANPYYALDTPRDPSETMRVGKLLEAQCGRPTATSAECAAFTGAAERCVTASSVGMSAPDASPVSVCCGLAE
jgi:hypothetical protein